MPNFSSPTDKSSTSSTPDNSLGGSDATLDRPVSYGGRLSWALFDWAGQPYFTLIVTFIFAPYFATAFIGEPVRGQQLWGYTQAAAGIFIALLSPVLGAIADAAGARKPWLAFFSVIFVLAAMALWLAVPGAPQGYLFVVVSLVIASVAMEFAIVFNNAMLPSLVPESHMGRWSGFGWGLGYVGGLLVLLIVLFGFALPDTPLFGIDKTMHEPDRLVGPISGVWYALFVLPLFLFTPDRQRRSIGAGVAIRTGLRSLIETLKQLRDHRDIVQFLIARMIYQDGLSAIFAFGGVYGAGIFGWKITTLGIFGIVLVVFGAVGAFAGGWLDDRFGSKRTITISLIILFAGVLGALSVTSDSVFFGLPVAPPVPGAPPFSGTAEQAYLLFGCLIGLAGGPAQAASRTMLARLAPRSLMTEFFGLFALSGKATAFAAPLIIGIVTGWAGSQRAGLAVVAVFVVTGFVLLLPVKEVRVRLP